MPSNLFSPLTVRAITFKNRIGMSPMCMYSSENGFANDWHLVHLGSRAVGGAGLIMTEATAITPEGRISPQDLGIWEDAHVAFLSRITSFIQQQGSIPGLQLAHAGRKGSFSRPWEGSTPISKEKGGWQTVAPSALAYDPENNFVPKALDPDEILEIISAYKKAAQRALEAGFKVLEIHAANGYLLHQFLSPLSNQRTDSYGQSFENRTRLLREIVQAIRQTWPDNLPLFVRISAVDWHEKGWQLENSVELAKQLKPLGVDLIDCQSGGIVHNLKIPFAPGFQVGFAEKIKTEANILTAAVGLITEPHQANAILRQGQADMAFLAREELRTPYWPLHAANVLEIEQPWPVQYLRAKPVKP